MKGALDALIASGEIQPTIAIMPDAPWSSRASYYVDSGYTGADPGRKVETAFTKDLIAHVDATYRTVANRTGRGIAGYSMGGYGALRYSLAHPDLFGASIVLSPAVYVPKPAERLQHARVRRVRAGQEPLRRLDLQEAQLPGPVPVVLGDRPAAADVHRRRRRRVQEPGSEGRDPRPRLRGPRPLQPGGPRAEPDRRAARRRRRPRLGRLGADVRRGRQVHLPVPQPDARDADEGHADRHRPGGAGGRRRDRRGGQRLPGARGRRAPSPASRTSATRTSCSSRTRPRGTRLWTRELGYGPARAGVRRRDRSGRRRRRHRLHERRPRRRPRRQHDRRRLRRQVRPERQSQSGCASSAFRPWPTAATRSRPTRPGTST